MIMREETEYTICAFCSLDHRGEITNPTLHGSIRMDP